MKKQKPSRTGSPNAGSKDQEVSSISSLDTEVHVPPNITRSEAEVMFIIKSNAGIETKDIPQRLQEYFKKTKSRNRVSEIINAIEKKQKRYERRYIDRSKSFPITFTIPEQHSVDKRLTAAMLLELRAAPALSVGDEPTLENFKRHLRKTYPNIFTDLDKRIKTAEENGYVTVNEHEAGDGTFVKQIREDTRMRLDLEYLILLTVDYLRDIVKRHTNCLQEQKELLQQEQTDDSEKRVYDLLERNKLLSAELKESEKQAEHLRRLLYAVKPRLRQEDFMTSDIGGD